MDRIKYERPLIKKLESQMPNKYGLRTEYKPMTEIDGVSVKDLIKEFGSPLFVISEKRIRQNFKRAQKAFTTRYPKVQFAWSYKTNYIGAVCNIFHQEGSWAEVVSGFEFRKALDLGVNGRNIIFNGPDKTEADLLMAVQNDALIHIDHLDELYTLTELATQINSRPRVAIRVNMDTGIFPIWDRFGFNYENGQAWDALNKIMHSNKLDLEGLHCHIGTFILQPNAYGVATQKLVDLALGLKRKFGHSIKYLDLGGGFASGNTLKGAFLPGVDTNPTFDDYAEVITSALLNSELPPSEMPALILESGRALIDDAGYLISSVIANKRSSKGKRVTILDAGVNILFTSFWYNHKVTPAQEFTGFTEDTTLYGPLCMNIDVIREEVTLPLMNKGDQIVIHHVGAYNMTQWMQFITLRPAVVLVNANGNAELIREGEKNENVTSMERIPSHLRSLRP